MSQIQRSRSARARHWQALVRQQEESGLTQAAFCRERQINLGTFAWWRRKCRTADADGSAAGTRPQRGRIRPTQPSTNPHRFMEVEVVGARSKRYEIVVPSGWRLRIPTDFDAENVTRLIRAVEAAC